jgi:hypothetical protein
MYNLLTKIIVNPVIIIGSLIKQKILFLIDVYLFVCENNPLLLDYYEKEDEKDKKDEKEIDKDVREGGIKPVKEGGVKPVVKEEKFEDKYLEKFKSFPNEFLFNELELEEEQTEYERIKSLTEINRTNSINEIENKLVKIKEIEENSDISNDRDKKFTENINNFGINKLLDYFDLHEEYEDDPDYIDFEELYTDIIKEKNILNTELNEIEKNTVTDNEFKEMTRKKIINKKLDNFIDNYVLENTPMGIIYMRYNNSKGSFEYFSNNTIPYRYLEPVGRKYVMTYWCKPIFVDTEEELKRSEIKYNEDLKKKEKKEKEEEEKRIIFNNPKIVLAKMKSYNKDTKNATAIRPMKNRSSNNALPSQIKATFQNINQTSEKKFLKENSNRYTWEGRLTDFCPLKKVNKNVVNKNLAMTYADFKRIQQEQQNKK